MSQSSSDRNEALKRALKGYGTGLRSKLIVLRNAPLIADVEATLQRRGGSWTKTFEDQCAAASLAIFGVSRSDVDPPEPHPDSFGNDDRHSQYLFSDKAFASYDAALSGWYAWCEKIAELEKDVLDRGAIEYWRERGYDICDGAGYELGCFAYFARQMLVAWKHLLPNARITLDGSGKRAPESVEAWGAALAAQAARFKRTE